MIKKILLLVALLAPLSVFAAVGRVVEGDLMFLEPAEGANSWRSYHTVICAQTSDLFPGQLDVFTITSAVTFLGTDSLSQWQTKRRDAHRAACLAIEGWTATIGNLSVLLVQYVQVP